MQRYGSQFQEFFGGTDDCRRNLMAYAGQVSKEAPAMERFWQASC
jgi:hypothetical protein